MKLGQKVGLIKKVKKDYAIYIENYDWIILQPEAKNN